MLTTTYEQANGVVTIRMNRPRVLNALNYSMMDELIAALQTADSDADVSAIVISGVGRAFCSGWDRSVKADSPTDTLTIDQQGRSLVQCFEGLAKPTVAALHGPVVGGGVLIAASCDIRTAARDTWFWLPEVTFGSPIFWTGLAPLVREIGFPSTRWLALSGSRESVEWGERWGLVNEVVDGDAEKRAFAIAEHIGGHPSTGVANIKDDLRAIAEAQVPARHCHSALTVWESLASPNF